MNTENTLPLDLFKANVEMQLRICQLLQTTSHQWLEIALRASEDNIAEFGAEIENLLQATSWQALAMQPGAVFWRQFQQRIGDVQAAAQLTVSAQTTFTSGLQQAIQEWQKTGIEAFGDRTDFTLPFNDLFKQWGAVWASAAASGDEAVKGGANHG